jgi:hypothetical protein
VEFDTSLDELTEPVKCSGKDTALDKWRDLAEETARTYVQSGLEAPWLILITSCVAPGVTARAHERGRWN